MSHPDPRHNPENVYPHDDFRSEDKQKSKLSHHFTVGDTLRTPKERQEFRIRQSVKKARARREHTALGKKYPVVKIRTGVLHEINKKNTQEQMKAASERKAKNNALKNKMK